MTRSPARAWTAPELEALVRGRHPEPAWAVLSNVASTLGRGTARRADAVAMGPWSSVGLKLHGFELKVSRHDWVRELQDVEKAEAVGRFCDLWWVVAPPAVVKLEELPALWGLLEPSGNGLKVRRPATVRPNVEAVSRGFLAAVFRKVSEVSTVELALKAAREEGRREGFAQGEASALRRGPNADAARELEQLKALVARFQEASGVDLSATWNAAGIGKAVQLVLAGQEAEQRAAQALRTARNQLQRALEYLPKDEAEESTPP